METSQTEAEPRSSEFVQNLQEFVAATRRDRNSKFPRRKKEELGNAIMAAAKNLEYAIQEIRQSNFPKKRRDNVSDELQGVLKRYSDTLDEGVDKAIAEKYLDVFLRSLDMAVAFLEGKEYRANRNDW